jgi:AraC family transcriptional regulator
MEGKQTIRYRARWEALAGPANFSARKLASLCRLSPRQLQRQFRRSLGCTPQQWLNARRILVAQQRLLSGEPVKKVASDLGFKYTSYFYMQFKAATRMTPAAFILEHADIPNVAGT